MPRHVAIRSSSYFARLHCERETAVLACSQVHALGVFPDRWEVPLQRDSVHRAQAQVGAELDALVAAGKPYTAACEQLQRAAKRSSGVSSVRCRRSLTLLSRLLRSMPVANMTP